MEMPRTRAIVIVADANLRSSSPSLITLRVHRVGGVLCRLSYFIIPSFIWSIVYRDPKVVVDVFPLAILEGFLGGIVGRCIRIAWASLCLSMLLLEWNIFPESYLFYSALMLRAATFPQGRSIVAGAIMVIIFLALPTPKRARCSTMIVVLATYLLLLGCKGWSTTKPFLVWLRQPAPRALQVAWSDAERIGAVSVAPHAYNAQSFGHEQIVALLQSNHRPLKIFVIVLESWGEAVADTHRVETDVRKIAFADQVLSGYTEFSGPTLSGEIRELCGRALSFTDMTSALADCLPHSASKLGYTTTSFHGYDGYFYNRSVVYPQLGFERSWFKKDFGDADRCSGAFDGICDDVVLRRAVSQLRRAGPQFVYMMSLSAHEPISGDMAHRAYIDALVRRNISQQTVNEALIRLAVLNVRTIASNQRGGTLLYMVGDHNPPGDGGLSLPLHMVPYVMVRWN